MRLATLMIWTALLLAAVAGAQTPQQYATGSSWEATLAGCPEVSLAGASAIAAFDGNTFVLHENRLIKLGPNLVELASVQLPDLPQAVSTVEATRYEITCGMQGAELGYQYGSTAPLTTYGADCAPGAAAISPQTGLQQCVDNNMMQGLHQAHTLGSLGQATLAADQFAVYLLRGGRLTVFDNNLREIRSRDLSKPAPTAAECAVCQAMGKNGTLMDQVRFRGMTAGLCPGPGQFSNQWNRPASALVPTSIQQPAPQALPYAPRYPETSRGPVIAPGISVPAPVGPGAFPTAPGGAATGFGTGVTIPTGFETTINHAQPALEPTPDITAPATGGSFGLHTPVPATGTQYNQPAVAATTGRTVVTNDLPAGFETAAPEAGQYAWMWKLKQLVPGAIYPLARRPIKDGALFFGVSGDQQRGPQQLHLNMLDANGRPDAEALVLSAYLYQRGDSEAGRSLPLRRNAPGEYVIHFDSDSVRGDTLAVRVSRPGQREEVTYLSLSGPELEPSRVHP